jgi:hypothetical protein
MMSSLEILRLLEEDTFTVYGFTEEAVNINNSGSLNREKLDKIKNLFLRRLLTHLTDEIVRETQHYPHDDISMTEFEADFVIIKRPYFDAFKKYVEKQIENEVAFNKLNL